MKEKLKDFGLYISIPFAILIVVFIFMVDERIISEKKNWIIYRFYALGLIILVFSGVITLILC